MRQLSREHHIYALEPGSDPAITIDSGEELMVETWDVVSYTHLTLPTICSV